MSAPAQEIEAMFCLGEPLDRVLTAGDADGWTRDDVMAVLKDRGWDLDPSGRLPRMKRVTTPAGLRVLPPEAMKKRPEPKPAEPKPAEHATAEPARRAATCGTRSGYERHRRTGEEPCRACRESNRDRPRTGPKLKPIPHGSMAGYRAHYRRHELPVCTPCNDAYRAHGQAKAAQKKARTVAEQAAASSAAIAVELDTWFADAQRSPSPRVQRAARAAISSLLQLRAAMDDLAREQRRAALRTQPTGETA